LPLDLHDSMKFGNGTYSSLDLASNQSLLHTDDKNLWPLSNRKQIQKLLVYHILIFLYPLRSMPLLSACSIPNFPNKNYLLMAYSSPYIFNTSIVYHRKRFNDI